MTCLAIIGAGRMGQAVLSGLLAAGWERQDIVVAEAHEPTARAVEQEHGVTVLPAAQAVARADAVLIAVKPADVLGLLSAISRSMPGRAVVISLAAGMPLAALEAHLPPGTAVIRVMPNTPALVGQGMSAMSPGRSARPDDIALAERVLGAVGRVVRVAESAQDAVTAVSGSGPAYLFYLAEAMVDAGVMLGLGRPLATELAAQTLHGAAAMLVSSGQSAAVLRENVTSPGGTTAAAVHVLEEKAVRAAVANAMRACRDRSAEMARLAAQPDGG